MYYCLYDIVFLWTSGFHPYFSDVLNDEKCSIILKETIFLIY